MFVYKNNNPGEKETKKSVAELRTTNPYKAGGQRRWQAKDITKVVPSSCDGEKKKLPLTDDCWIFAMKIA